jgi:hypothetical protein
MLPVSTWLFSASMKFSSFTSEPSDEEFFDKVLAWLFPLDVD